MPATHTDKKDDEEGGLTQVKNEVLYVYELTTFSLQNHAVVKSCRMCEAPGKDVWNPTRVFLGQGTYDCFWVSQDSSNTPKIYWPSVSIDMLNNL